MKTLFRTLFLLTILYETQVPLVLGYVVVRFPNAFTQGTKFKEALDLELRYLARYGEDKFQLFVEDTTDYRTFCCYPDFVVRYKNGIVYLVGEFDKYKAEGSLRKYCATLVRVFLWISQCGYRLRLVESEEDIGDDFKGFLEWTFTPDSGEICLRIHAIHRQEIFFIANQILSGNLMIDKLVLIGYGTKLKKFDLTRCLSREITFQHCELQPEVVRNLLLCERLETLKLSNCIFPAEILIEFLKAESFIKTIQTIDLTNSILDEKTKALFWVWGHIRSVDILGIESNPERGYKYYDALYE